MQNEEIWYQQDGATAHYNVNVRNYLNGIIPDHWIGKRGFIKWPARSPDLTTLDFYLCGKVKIYANRPNNI